MLFRDSRRHSTVHKWRSAASQQRKRHSEEPCAIYPLLHTRAQGCSWLASCCWQGKESTPSLPPGEHRQFCSLGPLAMDICGNFKILTLSLLLCFWWMEGSVCILSRFASNDSKLEMHVFSELWSALVWITQVIIRLCGKSKCAGF